MSIFNRKNRGVSLVELMVSMAVFSLISIALVAILTIGMKSWRTVDSKSEAEVSLNKAVADINCTVRNSNLADIRYYSGDTTNSTSSINLSPNTSGGGENNEENNVVDTTQPISTFSTKYGCGVLVCPSYASTRPLNDSASASVYSIYEYESSKIINGVENVNNFYVAYFCLKPSDCFQCKDLFGGLSDFCPHKKLIKRWYTNPNATFEESFTFTINNYSENQVKSDIESYSSQSFDKILASNVMAFSAVKNTNTLDYSIKVFKPNVNQTRVTNKDIEDSIKAFYALPEKVSGTDADNYFKTFNSANIDPISAYVLQINSTIVPLN